MLHPFEYERDEEGEFPCCICGKTTKGEQQVVINHDAGDWPALNEEEDKLSLYPIGPDCARRVKKQGIGIIGN